jgi:hypothetical protein
VSFVTPSLPGTNITFTGARAPRILPAAADTVAIPLVADWGPLGADAPGIAGRDGGPQEITSFAEFTGLFGDSDTAGRTAVAGAFAGQGLPGFPGAGAVLVYRMGGATVAKATISILGAGVGGVATLRLDGRYSGVRGNRISYTLDSDPTNAANDRLRLYLDGVLQETYIYTAPALAALATAINSRSVLVRATALVADTAPARRLVATTNPVLLAGGNDGATVASADHLAALAGIEFKQFGIVVPYDLTSAPILASYLAWVQAQQAKSRPVRLVVGGVAGETVDTAIARSGTLNDPHVVNVGGGTFHDDLLGKDLSTSQLAPRIAGILAAKSDEHSLTFAKVGGLHSVIGNADDQVQAAVDNGVTVLAPTSSPDADLRIEKGVTTYTGDTNAMPQDVYGDPRIVGVMDNYVRAMKLWGDDNVIGNLPVNDDTRNLVRGYARSLEDDLLTRGLILPANPRATPPIPAPWVVVEDPGDPALSDAIPYTFGWQFAKTANYIIGQGTVL